MEDVEEYKNILSLEKNELLLLLEKLHFYCIHLEEATNFIYLRMAIASAFIPGFILSILAQHSLTPYICARITVHLSTERASNLAVNFKPDFLCETSLHLDPAIVARITPNLKDKLIKQVLSAMINRQYWGKIASINSIFDEFTAFRVQKLVDDSVAVAHVLTHLEAPDQIVRMSENMRPEIWKDAILHLLEINKEDFERIKMILT